MVWYSGGISEAIKESKAKGAIFVVYIEGQDDQSLKITNSINTGEIGEKLANENFVAIKIEAGSVHYRQFSEIFKEPSVPSIYFIGKTGTPLDIIKGTDDLNTVPKRIQDVLQKAGIAVQSTAAAVSESLIQSEQADNLPSNVVCDNGVCTIKKDSTESGGSSEEKKDLSPEEKVERAKELLQKKKEEKEQEENEKERLKEIERRKMGQNVQHLKKWQEDQELKQIKEDREREKRENQQARERVLAQIAQDKAERLSKSQAKPASPEPSNSQATSSISKPNANTTRLQFKLPDGSSYTQEFAISDSLQSVVTFIKTNLNLPFSNFRLSTTFPRREFVENDYSQSLSDLQLVPNAVILVLPLSKGTVSTNQGSTLNSMVWSFFAPLFQIFGFLKNFIFGTNPNTRNPSKKPADESKNRSENPRSRAVRDSTVVKKQGNVHRLHDRKDSDDESNTWNGNSTQQM